MSALIPPSAHQSLPLPQSPNYNMPTGDSMHANDDRASIEVIDGSSTGTTNTIERASSVAKTMICNRCNAEIFGGNDLSPSACCGDMICNLCWTAISRKGSQRCTRTGCDNALLKRLPIYLSEDSYDRKSKKRDMSRQTMADSDLINQQLSEDIVILEARLDLQSQRLDDQTEMRSALNGQIRSASDRLEAVNKDITTLNDLHTKTRDRTEEALARNEELSAKISFLREQIANIDSITVLPPNAPA
ncbi:hypothetical protein MD484_g8584, partial [Candolleomyces efflorescens]